jgi:hypothetical protein
MEKVGKSTPAQMAIARKQTVRKIISNECFRKKSFIISFYFCVRR